MYDLVGDIHGHAVELWQLLEELGYREQDGRYLHANRKIIFVGDFIDRGPQIREVLQTVRAMIAGGSALAVMGNHEFNAIAYHTTHPEDPNRYLRSHSEKNVLQHAETVRQVPVADLRDYVEWFRTLPMWLEKDGLRVVHACWDEQQMAVLQESLQRFQGVTDAFMLEALTQQSPLFHAIDDVLKGKEVPLPDGQTLRDKDGHERSKMRIRWFESPQGRTYADYALSSEGGFPSTPVPVEFAGQVQPYDRSQPPVFFGHYWLRGEQPKRLASNVACLDFSVAKGGQLCAYRWDGESDIDDEKFVSVPAADCEPASG